MALRFRCEHCGKRLQVDLQPGAQAICPYCHSNVVVPADAQVHTPQQPAAASDKPQSQQQEGVEGEEELVETNGDKVIAFLATYLPSWGTSIVLHLALILICLMGAWVKQKVPEKIEYTAEVRIEKPKQFVVNRDQKEQRMQGQRSRSTRRVQTESMSSFVFKQTSNPIPDVASNNLKTVEVIGVGGGGAEMGGLSGFGTGRGGGGGGGGGAEFFGVGAVARKIAYVVDRSGSMTDTMMYVKYELKRSLRQLKPNQSFYVIFYSSGPAVEMSVRKLLPAVEANKQQAYEFIDSIVPIGQTDPSDALKRAFEIQPDIIYLLTDGEFDKSIVSLIDKLNPKKDGQITINTICFIYSNGEAMLQQIAQKNGGTYKYVGESDLDTLGR